MDKLVEQQRRHFNEISARYSQARKHSNHLLLKELIWKEFIQKNSGIATQVSNVLEPMCGMADGYHILRKHLTTDFDYVGFDYSEGMVKMARLENPSLAIQWQDVNSYRLSGSSFDCIILIGGLHHVFTHAQQIIKNLGQCLRQGGLFFSLEPTHNNPLARRIRRKIYNSNALFDPQTERAFEYNCLLQHFKSAGFTLVDEVYPGLSAYILFYNPDVFPALNIGGGRLVRNLFFIDKLFWRSWPGRKLSFATLSLWRKN